jgi:hypothetical protein
MNSQRREKVQNMENIQVARNIQEYQAFPEFGVLSA